jgi:transposase
MLGFSGFKVTEVFMFFVDKINKNSKNSVLQLIKSERINGQSRQVIVLSLGADYTIPVEIRKEVAKAVTEKLKGLACLFASPEIEKYADDIVRKIQQKGDSVFISKVNEQEDMQEVLIDKVTHEADRLAGPLLVGDAFWRRLDFDSILAEVGFGERDRKIAELSILNRLISQDSEYLIPVWTKLQAASDIVYAQAEEVGKDCYYRISDKLLGHQSKIEKLVYEKISTVFGLSSSIYLFDLTNTYFEGSCQLNPNAEYGGHQKEKRNDCLQIVIALLLDGDGFVINHTIFNGKMSDAKSLAKILTSIRKSCSGLAEMPTLIFDRGITSDENVKLLQESKLNYIIAARNPVENEHLADFSEADFISMQNKKKQKVEVYVKKTEGEHYLLCKSEGRKNKEAAMRTNKEKLFIKALESLRKQLSDTKKIGISTIAEQIGRIREKYAGVAQFYAVEYIPYQFDFTVTGDIHKKLLSALTLRKEKALNSDISYKTLAADLEKFKQKYDFSYIKIHLQEPVLSVQTHEEKLASRINMEGNYLLRTNRTDLDETSFWHIYTMLSRIEHAFRHLKSDLGLRPNYHHLEDRVDGHVFITILAYQLLQSIEFTLRENSCNLSWRSVKRLLSSHTYSTIIMPTRDGKVIHLRKLGEAESVQKEIYKKLNIAYEKMPATKVIIK